MLRLCPLEGALLVEGTMKKTHVYISFHQGDDEHHQTFINGWVQIGGLRSYWDPELEMITPFYYTPKIKKIGLNKPGKF